MDIDVDLQNIEVGHTPASIRESLLEKVIKMGDKFVLQLKKNMHLELSVHFHFKV